MKKIFKYLLLAAIVLGFIVAYSAYTKVFRSIVDQNTSIYITKTDHYDTLLDKLKEAKIIKDAPLFEALADKMNLKSKIFPGKYILNKGSNTLDVIRKFRGNKQTAVKLVINNVNFKKDLASKISAQLNFDSVEILNYLNNQDQVSSIGYDLDNIMCLFIPNTYEMYWSPKFSSFETRMLKEHDAFWTTERLEKAKAKGLTSNEAFILASIVEKEYKFASERKRIAGVYLNRLEIKMPLQADPTCKFAWGDLSLKRVLNIHTRNPHPYNTYYINGLPPGPICLPETSTIDAVLNAEDHSYFYFCAHADLDGKHEFNKTLSAHNAAARKYQQALNKLKIY